MCGSTEEIIQVYKEGDYGDCSDRVTGFGSSVETMTKNKNEVFFIGCEDGWVKICTFFPHNISIFESHVEDNEDPMPITKIGISHCE